MLRIPTLLAATALSFTLLSLAGHSLAGVLSSSASCTDGSNASVQWTFVEDPKHPVDRPDWVGYDLLRRSLSECGPPVRVNDTPFPRVVGTTHGHTFTEPAPSAGTEFEYQIILVDANRQQVSLNGVECDCGGRVSFTSCPELSAPITQGTIEDWGWTLFVSPCGGAGCYGGFYLEGTWPQELRQYAGTNTVVRFFGRAICGTVEGCALTVDHYELGDCSVTPGAAVSWGRVKTIYR